MIPYTWNSNGSLYMLMQTTAGEQWVRREQTVTTVWKCVHQSQGSIIFSSRRAGTESGHIWFLYERAVEATIQKQSKGIFIPQPCAPLWILHSGWCFSFNIHGNHYNVHNRAPHNNNKKLWRRGLICK